MTFALQADVLALHSHLEAHQVDLQAEDVMIEADQAQAQADQAHVRRVKKAAGKAETADPAIEITKDLIVIQANRHAVKKIL
jgi:hypothetical protein